MNILFIGDIVGQPGREYIVHNLNRLRTEYRIDICVANGENVSHGNSITTEHAKLLWSAGVDVITMGNHTFNRNMAGVFESFPHIIRPANYNRSLPGCGSLVFDTGCFRLGVINVQGQVFLEPIDSPFSAVDAEIAKIKDACDAMIVDFHAEATSEKGAMAHYLDGRVAAVVGTHTHVQTADERLLPKGTAFISDVGMTGVTHSILGTRVETIVSRFAKQTKEKFELAEGNVQFNAVVICLDGTNPLPKSIQRINI